MLPSRRWATLGLAGVWIAGVLLLLLLRTHAVAPASTSAIVGLHIEDPQGASLLATQVLLPPGSQTVLAALQEASRLQGFTVELQDYAGLGTMVTSIYGYHNKGACGWVYEVNGTGGDRSAKNYLLSEGDTTRWFWSCDPA